MTFQQRLLIVAALAALIWLAMVTHVPLVAPSLHRAKLRFRNSGATMSRRWLKTWPSDGLGAPCNRYFLTVPRQRR